jgi:menaquinone-dependent protoporphyrinogen oxidase
MRVLVVFGSKHGGTEGLAHEVGAGLIEAGHEVLVRSARGVDDLSACDAVVVGGALYASFWHKNARRFVRRHEDDLRLMPVWFFSSGPLDDSASKGDIAPTWHVKRWMDRVRARGHVTFGGRLSPEVGGFAALPRGDFRDMSAARSWGRSTGVELASLPLSPRPRLSPVRRDLRRWLSEAVAFGAGATLLAWLIAEMAVRRTFHWLDALYLAVALGTVAMALWLWNHHRRARRPVHGS